MTLDVWNLLPHEIVEELSEVIHYFFEEARKKGIHGTDEFIEGLVQDELVADPSLPEVLISNNMIRIARESAPWMFDKHPPEMRELEDLNLDEIYEYYMNPCMDMDPDLAVYASHVSALIDHMLCTAEHGLYAMPQHATVLLSGNTATLQSLYSHYELPALNSRH